MKNIVFIAPPAAGKGTQSDNLVSKYGYKHISTGDLLREEVASGSTLGNKLSELMKRGELISDEIVNELLTKALMDEDKPFILDGYPRNEKQIYFLEDILNKVNKKIDVVIYLNVPEDVACQRATGRLVCPSCNRSFHKITNKPLTEGICDYCKTELVSRSDDTEETFKIRYNRYVENVKPILDYYESKGLLKVIDKLDKDEVFEEIEKVIN